MIVVATSGIKTKTEPEAIGEVTKRYRSTLFLMKDNGEIIREIKTSIATTSRSPIISKSGKWISQTSSVLDAGDIGLINTETGEVLLDHALAYHILLENPQLPYKATRFKKGYEKLREFGGIYKYPEDKIVEIMKTYAAMHLAPLRGERSFSNNEKIMTVDARNEIRIYDLETLELIDIITYSEILKALARAKAPRKMMRWAVNGKFRGIINAENPELLWIEMDADNCAAFLMDIENKDIVSPIRHPYDLLRKYDIAPYTKFIPDLDKPWDKPLEAISIQLHPTPTENILMELVVRLEKTKAPRWADCSRLRHEIACLAFDQHILILLNQDFEPVTWRYKYEINGVDHVTSGPARFYPDYLVVIGTGFMPLDPDLKENYGWMRLDWKTLRIEMYVDFHSVKNALVDAIDVRYPNYVLGALPGDYAPRLYRNELLVGGTTDVPLQWKEKVHEYVFVARYDPISKKARPLQIWEGLFPARKPPFAIYNWGAFV